MSTIEAKSHHRGSSSLSAAPPPSRLRIVRQALTYASVGPSGSAARRVVIVLGLVVGSALVAASSAIHLELWSTGYRTIHVIGPLFLIQGLAGALLAVLLLLSRRLLVVALAAGFMIATIGGLLLSISVGLFGFMDTLAAPYAGLSLGMESAGAIVLSVLSTILVRGDGRPDLGAPHADRGKEDPVLEPAAVKCGVRIPSLDARVISLAIQNGDQRAVSRRDGRAPSGGLKRPRNTRNEPDRPPERVPRFESCRSRICLDTRDSR